VESGAINVLILVLVAEILNKATALAPSIEVGEHQKAIMPSLKEYVTKSHTQRADLLEYSSWSVGSLIEVLSEKQAQIRLLVCHPDSALNDEQKETIRAGDGQCMKSSRVMTG
jgi:hypothetical protein